MRKTPYSINSRSCCVAPKTSNARPAAKPPNDSQNSEVEKPFVMINSFRSQLPRSLEENCVRRLLPVLGTVARRLEQLGVARRAGLQRADNVHRILDRGDRFADTDTSEAQTAWEHVSIFEEAQHSFHVG